MPDFFTPGRRRQKWRSVLTLTPPNFNGGNQFMQKVIIVGTGCAGLTAAIYTARANLNPLVLEGREPGGQLSTTTLVENYPGFPDGIDGPQLVMNMKEQAAKFGSRFEYAHLEDIDPCDGHIRVKIDERWVETRALIVASGASARWLGLE